MDLVVKINLCYTSSLIKFGGWDFFSGKKKSSHQRSALMAGCRAARAGAGNRGDGPEVDDVQS